ncbi:MAG TPA: sugar phosphate nucleotidyltransferase [Candidatus Acidoferrales bacterium]|nr:sugar phosphate nucleotidyltransferase [Candidatus Acidoferrales bacterium]
MGAAGAFVTAARKGPEEKASVPTCAVLLAGGRGTRFWPRSRMRTPKQLLNITGNETMLRETVARLKPIVPLRDFWVVTNAEQSTGVRRELRGVPSSQVLAEPVGRNTAAAIGLAAIHLAHKHGDSLMAVLPADSYVADAPRYRKLVRAALNLASTPGNLVVLGVPPTRPETGYGYIERGGVLARPRGVAAYAVRRFTEKPGLPAARKYLASGKYLWNAGMFFWRASTFLENLERFLPETHAALAGLAKTIGTGRYASTLRRIYPRLKNISVDYAVMEPATKLRSAADSRKKGPSRSLPEVSVIPARVGWSDIGSWAAVYELLAPDSGANVSAGPLFALEASGNYFWSPKKFIAAIDVNDLVLVETDDAILLCPRGRSQDVGKIVKWLEGRKLSRLL